MSSSSPTDLKIMFWIKFFYVIQGRMWSNQRDEERKSIHRAKHFGSSEHDEKTCFWNWLFCQENLFGVATIQEACTGTGRLIISRSVVQLVNLYCWLVYWLTMLLVAAPGGIQADESWEINLRQSQVRLPADCRLVAQAWCLSCETCLNQYTLHPASTQRFWWLYFQIHCCCRFKFYCSLYSCHMHHSCSNSCCWKIMNTLSYTGLYVLIFPYVQFIRFFFFAATT